MTLGINSSALLSYYQLKAGVSASTSASTSTAAGLSNRLSGSKAAAPTPPWDQTQTPAQTNAEITAAIDGASIINPNAVKLNVPGAHAGVTSSANYRNLFALYQGLNTLKALAAQAAKPNQSTGQLAQLQRAFANGLAQVQTFLGNSPFTGFKVEVGSDSPQQTTAAGVLKETDNYSTGTVYAGDPNVADPALQGNIAFSANVLFGAGNQTTVNFNLADLGSTPRTLGNVVNYLNSQLKAAGVDTYFSVVQTPATPQVVNVGGGRTVTLPAGPTQYSLQINGNSFETLTFSAPTQTPAIYVAQTAGINATTTTSTGSPTSSSNSSSATSGSGAIQQLLKINPSASSPYTFTDALGKQVTNVTATAVGPDGSVYVLGDINGATTAGEIDSSQKIAGSQDVALLKYDSAGDLISTNVLGAANSASGLALAVSQSGAVAVAGTVTGQLDGTTTPSDATTPTSFVSVYDSSGNPLFTARQNASAGDQVNSVAFGADGSVYVGGTTQSSLTGGALSGQSAGYITGYSPTGAQTFTTQLGSAGSNSVTGIAVDGASIITAGVQNGDAVVNSFTIPTSGGTPTLTATRDLGPLQGGSVAGVSINSDGSVIVAGSTHNGALSAGTVTTPYSSGEEAFVAQLSAGLTPQASDTLTYYKGSGDTTASALTVSGGQVYIAGQIAVPPTGGSSATSNYDGYVAQIDPTTGAVGYSNIISGQNNEDAPHGIAVSATGSSALDALGLPTGTINNTPNPNIVANSDLIAGDQFTITGYGVTRTVTIAANDTLHSLAEKIQSASSFQATAKVVTTAGVQHLEISPVNAGASVTLGPGPNGQNALPGLGLTAGVVTTATKAAPSKTNTLQASYGLNLSSSLNLESSANIAQAQAALTSATGAVARIYLNLTTPPTTKNAAGKPATTGAAPAYLSNEIASYQTALARLTSSTGGSGASIASLF